MNPKYEKVGLFGGTFNPPHVGHINSIQSVTNQLELSRVFVLPNFQSPQKEHRFGPSPEMRLEMTKVAMTGLEPKIQVDHREVKRGGVSYSIDTINSYLEEYSAEQLYLIIGVDQFGVFDHWHDWEELLKKTNLVVTSRPGLDLPLTLEDFPSPLLKVVYDFDGKIAELESGLKIYFLQLEDVEISASNLRKKIRSGEDYSNFIPKPLEDFIRENHLYENTAKKIGDFKKFTQVCGGFLNERSAINVMAYDLTELELPFEYSLIASGTSTRATSALGEQLVKKVKDLYNVYPQGSEGFGEGRWVVLDYGSLVVHLFYDYTRMEYHLEELWREGKPIALNPSDLAL